MTEIVMSTRTINGCIELLADRVRITRRTHAAPYGHSPDVQEIPLTAIRAIRCHKPGLVCDGYVQMALVTQAMAGAAVPGPAEHRVVVHARQQADIRRLHEAIVARLQETTSATIHAA